MQKLYVIIPLIILFLGCFTVVNAQEYCDDVGENSFTDTCAEQMGDGTSGPVVAPPVDIYDASTGAGGSDGTPDLQITIESTVCNSGCGMGGPYNIGGCVGGNGSLGTNSDFAAAFNNGNGENTCINAGGYVCYTIDFINGFTTTAAGFDLGQSSNNGSSEGYEGSFGYVTAATDANGVPLTNLPAINLANFCNYTSADYATTQMSTFLGVTGPGTWQTDAQNTLANNTGSQASDANGQNICGVTTAESGEDTASGTGPDQGTGAAAANPNLGLAPTDIITQVKYIYFYSSTPSIDCDMDGLTAANSNPSGSWTGIDFCAPPICMITTPTASAVCDPDNPDNAIVTVTFDEMNSSGMFNILDNTGATVGTAMGTGAGITGTFTITGPTIAAPGTVFTIQDGTDLTCMVDVMVDIPECMQPPCEDYTATISGGGQVCNNVPVDLFVTMDGGTGPYTVTLSDGTVITGYMSGDAIPVAPAMNTTYGVATVLDADGCPAMVAGMAEVMVIISCANAGSINGSGN